MTVPRHNPRAEYIHREYPALKIRYENRHKEVRFWLSVGVRNGRIVGFDPERPGVVP